VLDAHERGEDATPKDNVPIDGGHKSTRVDGEGNQDDAYQAAVEGSEDGEVAEDGEVDEMAESVQPAAVRPPHARFSRADMANTTSGSTTRANGARRPSASRTTAAPSSALSTHRCFQLSTSKPTANATRHGPRRGFAESDHVLVLGRILRRGLRWQEGRWSPERGCRWCEWEGTRLKLRLARRMLAQVYETTRLE
jgi:hypothetical protein